MEQNVHKIDKETLAKTPPLIFLQKKITSTKSVKTVLPFCSSHGLRTLKSDAPVCCGCHPAGDNQSNKQSLSHHTDSSAWDVNPYDLLLFRQHNLVPIFSPKKCWVQSWKFTWARACRIGPNLYTCIKPHVQKLGYNQVLLWSLIPNLTASPKL